MARQILIQLGQDATAEAPAAVVHWRLAEDSGLGPVTAGPLSEAAPSGMGARVVCFVPTEQVLLTSAALPARSRQRLMQALPYVLEEHLIGDVEELHFALGQRQDDDHFAVAVVSRERIEAWLNLLRSDGLQADALVPDVFGLPLEPGAWSVLVEPERVLVRTAGDAGFCADRDAGALLLERALADAGEQGPQYLDVFVTSDADEAFAAALAADRETRMRVVPMGLLELAGEGFSTKAVFNLLQGDYSRRERLSKHLRQWYPAAALLVVWLGVQLAVQIYDYSQLSNQSARLQQEIETVYRGAFPDAKRVVNARSQMEHRLSELRKASGRDEGSVAEFLSRAAPVFRSTSNLVVQSLRFKPGQLDLELELKDLQALDSLKQRLSEEGGWQVEIQSASARGDKVESRMLIKKAGT